MIQSAAPLFPLKYIAKGRINCPSELRTFNGLHFLKYMTMRLTDEDLWELFLFSPVAYRDAEMVANNMKKSSGKFAEPVFVYKRQDL